MRVPLPVKFPADWPDFRVTSWTREKSPSHSTGRAVDIEIIGNYSKDIGSIYWYYYFETFFALWSIQKQGLTRLTMPPDCSHIHIFNEPSVNKIGLETVKSVNGKCTYFSHFDIAKTDYFGSLALKQLFSNYGNSDLAEYTHTFSYWWNKMSNTVTTQRTVYIHTNGIIPESNLRAIIDGVYTGSTWQVVKTELANAIGYVSSEQAAADIKGMALGGIGGLALAFLAYSVIKDMRGGTAADIGGKQNRRQKHIKNRAHSPSLAL